ncbi:heat shock protein 81-1-like [Dorcoceras hygrometricum]|uniref:Heat shock protein 81-1-like n=1 Tax=Dorcoceras hygrometricum TaxID=472368 RepID=A0A2Z7DBD5_9LAMI|nr:heat shock protein 81-1-like [Dorcoceras hygrometricum]
MGPTSNIGPKTSRAAQNRPEQNPRRIQQPPRATSARLPASSGATACVRGGRSLAQQSRPATCSSGRPDRATIARSVAQLSAAKRGQRATKCTRLLAMAGHHARPARMASRALWRGRWAAA